MHKKYLVKCIALIGLGACLLGVPSCAPSSDVSAAPSDVRTSARIATNPELTQFLSVELNRLRKVTPQRLAIVHNGTDDIDLQSWPGTAIAEKIRHYNEDCSAPIVVVPVRAENYDRAIVLWDSGADSRNITSIARIKRELERTLGQSISVARSGWEDLMTSAFSSQSSVSYSAKLPQDWNRLKPRGYSELHLSSYDVALARVREARTPQERLQAEDWFSANFLWSVLSECPDKTFEGLLMKNGWANSGSIVTRVLLDQRVRAGMTARELEIAAIAILDELQPSK